ncbi:MAG: hypothetical protein ACTSQP_22835 [Promethearchaeota archaeon]
METNFSIEKKLRLIIFISGIFPFMIFLFYMILYPLLGNKLLLSLQITIIIQDSTIAIDGVFSKFNLKMKIFQMISGCLLFLIGYLILTSMINSFFYSIDLIIIFFNQIILLNIVKIIISIKNKDNKSKYRIWLCLEGFISLLFSLIILFNLSRISYNILPFFIWTCLLMNGISNLVYAIYGKKVK